MNIVERGKYLFSIFLMHIEKKMILLKKKKKFNKFLLLLIQHGWQNTNVSQIISMTSKNPKRKHFSPYMYN